MLLTKEKQIADLLEHTHKGEQNAVFSKELERLFSLSGKEVRTIIHCLRINGKPICSSGDGYFYAANIHELLHTVEQLGSRSKHIDHAREGLLTADLLWQSGEAL